MQQHLERKEIVFDVHLQLLDKGALWEKSPRAPALAAPRDGPGRNNMADLETECSCGHRVRALHTELRQEESEGEQR